MQFAPGRMLAPPPNGHGFVLPLSLSCSALILLSSLSLQTLALHRHLRSRQAVDSAVADDAEQAVRMDFLQRASGANACLLAWPSQLWLDPNLCPGSTPARLQSGLSGALAWTLKAWDPSRRWLQIQRTDGRAVAIDLEATR